MSIQTLAQNMQAQGRNGDSMLVHMTPNEVGGLQSLAQAYGGSLTTNPATGLPEANFLEAILPTVLGIGLGFTPLGPLAAAGLVGGGTALVTGDLSKGLLAGLGAYGGSGLGSAVSAAGAATPAAAVSAMGVPGAATGTGSQAAMLADQAAGFGRAGLENIASSASFAPGATPTVMTPFQTAGLGLGEIAKAPGAFMSSNLKNIAAASAPILGASYNQEQPEETPDEGDIRQYEYTQEINPEFGLPGQPYFNQSYTPGAVTPAADFEGFAEGGATQTQGPYEQPTRTINPAVTEYNQKLMQRAQAEYNQAPQLAAFQSALPNQGVYNPEAGAAVQERQAQLQQNAKDIEATQFGYKYDPLSNSVIKTAPTVDQFQQLQDQINALSSRSRSYNYDSDGGYDSGGINYGYEMGYDYSDDGIGGDAGPSNASAADMGGEDVAQGGRIRRKFAQGGIASLKNNVPSFQAGGEMESDSFIVPADVVSALGNGSTDAGVDLLNQYIGMAMPIEGEGDGLSDDVPTSIEGDQPARVADGEVYIPAEVVAMLGQGDPELGSSKLYTMMDKIREAAHGKKDQQREVKPESVMPA